MLTHIILGLAEFMKTRVVSQTQTVFYFQPHQTNVVIFPFCKKKTCTHPHIHTHMHTYTRWSWHFIFGFSFLFFNVSMTYFNIPVQHITIYSLQYIFLCLFMVKFFPPCCLIKTLFLPTEVHLIGILKHIILRLTINIIEKFCYLNEYLSDRMVQGWVTLSRKDIP